MALLRPLLLHCPSGILIGGRNAWLYGALDSASIGPGVDSHEVTDPNWKQFFLVVIAIIRWEQAEDRIERKRSRTMVFREAEEQRQMGFLHPRSMFHASLVGTRKATPSL